MVKKVSSSTPATTENAFAKKALEAIVHIEQEAQRKKTEQLETLREALKNIDSRLEELQNQREQVEEAIGRITGKVPTAAKRTRRNMDEVRERVVRWMGARVGEKFGASDLQKEFPELEEVPSVAAFLKKPLDEKRVSMERPGGPRSVKYFVPKS